MGIDSTATGWLERAVTAVSISPQSAARLVAQVRKDVAGKESGRLSEAERTKVARKIVRRFAVRSGVSGLATSVPGAVLGLGTAVAVVGGGAADLVATLKFQTDMVTCLVQLFEPDLSAEETKHLAFSIALAGSISGGVGGFGGGDTRKVVGELTADKPGRASTHLRKLYRRVAGVFSQKAALKGLPSGIGVITSAGTNFGLTRFVGRAAIDALEKGLVTGSTARG